MKQQNIFTVRNNLTLPLLLVIGISAAGLQQCSASLLRRELRLEQFYPDAAGIPEPESLTFDAHTRVLFKNQNGVTSNNTKAQPNITLPLADFNNIKSQGVDVVYLWVNGSDPAHQARLQKWQEALQTVGWEKRRQHAVVKARFNADRDELRFSLRSLQWCMPWFRHLYIVTNGQVPSWMDVNNPRVTIVPEASIFEHAEDLPTFNSNAVEANLHRIPGITDAFIMMNDDFFFTKPWTLQDFITADGNELMLSAIHPVKTCRHGETCHKAATLHSEAMMYVDRLFMRYNSEERFGTAHGPQFVQKPVMQLVQHEFAEEFSSTVSHRFRSATELHVATTYKWFVEAHQPGHKHAVSGAAKLVHLRDNLAENNALYRYLQNVWMKPNTKSVCINDDTSDEQLLPLINEQAMRFLNDQYPVPSEFELPEGVVNGCTRWLTASYGQLPSEQEIAAACGGSLRVTATRA